MKTVTVIGGGAAGYTFAIRASNLGLSVNLVEKEYLGGTCLNKGCIPAKTLLESSKNFFLTKNNPFGVTAENVTFSTEKAYARVNSITQKLRNGVHTLIKSNGINFYEGTASITAEDTVSVNGNVLKSDFIVIASGASVFLPPIKGINIALTSENVVSGDYCDFESIAVIGGGVIGVEFATFFSELGKKVTVIEALDGVLCSISSDVSKYISMALRKKGVKIFAKTFVEEILPSEGQVKICMTVKDKLEEVISDKVLCCTGRTAVQIKSTLPISFDKGYVTNENFMTTVPNIYAIGDCVKGNIQLAHYAAAQGERLAAYLATGAEPRVKSVPSCVYCHPNAAIVGDTKEGEGRTVGKFNIGANGKALAEEEAFGFVKVVFDSDSTLIGAELVCPSASEMLGGIANLIDIGAKREDIISCIYPHPTVSEAFKEAAEDSISSSIHTVYKR